MLIDYALQNHSDTGQQTNQGHYGLLQYKLPGYLYFYPKNGAKLLLKPSKLLTWENLHSAYSGVLDVQELAGGVHVLVSSSTAVHHHPHAVWQGWAELLEVGERVGGLQGRDDALQTRYTLESCM